MKTICLKFFNEIDDKIIVLKLRETKNLKISPRPKTINSPLILTWS